MTKEIRNPNSIGICPDRRGRMCLPWGQRTRPVVFGALEAAGGIGDVSLNDGRARIPKSRKGRPKVAHGFNRGLRVENGQSPGGAKEMMGLDRCVLSSLTGLVLFSRYNPAMNRWAIFERPCGTWNHDTLNGYSRAATILRSDSVSRSTFGTTDALDLSKRWAGKAPASHRRHRPALRLVAALPRCAVSQSCTLRGVGKGRRFGPIRRSAE